MTIHLITVNVLLNLIMVGGAYAQELYNSCSNALEICPKVSVSVNNISANKTFCPSCEDDFSFCFQARNTIWLKFKSNASGGSATIDFSNPIFEPGKGTNIEASIVSAAVACDASTYSDLGSCASGLSGNFSLSANLAPSTFYYVVLNGAINGAGVTDPAEFTVDLVLTGNGVQRTAPTMSMEWDKPFYCKNDVATFTAHLRLCPDSSLYLWYINDTLVAQTVDSVFQTAVLENSDIVSVRNSCYTQCVVNPVGSSGMLPVFSFQHSAGLDQVLDPAVGYVQLQGSTQATSYFWTPITDLANPAGLSTIAGPLVTTTYYFTGQLNGCSLTDAVVVTVPNTELTIPNAFSPNEDGFNDTWKILGIENYPNCTVQIYDRWGQLVFATSGYSEDKAWDGKKNGKLLNESVYFYRIELRNAEKDLIKGSLTLIK